MAAVAVQKQQQQTPAVKQKATTIAIGVEVLVVAADSVQVVPTDGDRRLMMIDGRRWAMTLRSAAGDSDSKGRSAERERGGLLADNSMGLRDLLRIFNY